MSTGNSDRDQSPRSFDVVIIGAGLSGLYATYHLREAGLRVRTFDDADEVGGTWWWNSYPGARVDVPGGPYYCYTFSESLAREWTWEETQPDQASVQAYLKHVADRFNLHPQIQLSTRVTSARFDIERAVWTIETKGGEVVEAQFLVSAVGTLSAPHLPDIPGFETFRGEVVHPGRWPRDHEVAIAGARVGVIGTGSSGIQLIPRLAETTGQLTVFQRTPQYTVPARNQPVPADVLDAVRTQWTDLRDTMISSPAGIPNMMVSSRSALDVTEQERRETFEAAWAAGGLRIGRVFKDLLTEPEANQTLTDFIRSKILEIVDDPEVAAHLLPDYYYGTKRAVLDDGYYETYNRSNVSLVDLRDDPIVEIYADGVRTASGDHPLDTLVVATGYDAISGAITRLDPVGRTGTGLAEAWSEGVQTYLGLTVPEFPNLFVIHGPQTPSVLYNMALGAERQTTWISDCIQHMRRNGLDTVEPTATAASTWGARVRDIAGKTLFQHTDSWYVGANIPGKPREMLVYANGLDYYRELDDVAAESTYPGLMFGPSGETRSRTQPSHNHRSVS